MSDWREVGDRVVRPQIVDKEVEALRKLKAVLEEQVAKLERSRATAQTYLHRIRHGGGS